MDTQKSLSSILQEIAQIQTMERGKLSIISEGPSGPFYKIQAHEDGKNRTRYVRRDQVPAVQEAIAGYQQFKSLTEEYANRVVADTRQALADKKKAPAPQFLLAQDQEVQELMTRFLAGAATGVSVQELEVLLRAVIFKKANEVIGFLLQKAAEQADASYQPKPGEQKKDRVTTTVDGIFGSFPLERDYYYHPGKNLGHYPADAALGLEVGNTPALARLVCLEGADEASYLKAEQHLLETGGIKFSARQIQRLVQVVGADAQTWQGREALKPLPEAKAAPKIYVSADATGVRMRKEELEGRAGQQEDGRAKTRMSYLGCVFTQHKEDEKGSPIRDEDSTTYVSSFDSIDQFGPMLRQEAIRRGLPLAAAVILLIDGAAGLAKMGKVCFPTALQIVDFYHALEHAGLVLVALLGRKEHPDYKKRLSRWKKLLLRNGVEKLLAQARQESAGTARAAAVAEELNYFVNNVSRMQYGSFREKGYFIGSGVVEAGCKTVIGARCKQSGMFWRVRGAENILALRCIHASRSLAHFWKERLNAHAARNDCLSLAA